MSIFSKYQNTRKTRSGEAAPRDPLYASLAAKWAEDLARNHRSDTWGYIRQAASIASQHAEDSAKANDKDAVDYRSACDRMVSGLKSELKVRGVKLSTLSNYFSTVKVAGLEAVLATKENEDGELVPVSFGDVREELKSAETREREAILKAVMTTVRNAPMDELRSFCREFGIAGYGDEADESDNGDEAEAA